MRPAAARREHRTLLLPERARTAMLVGSLECLLHLGFSKAEMQTGHYCQDRLLKAGLPARQHEAVVGTHRGSPCFALALWLAQIPDEENDNHG